MRRVRWWKVLAAVVALGLMVFDILWNVSSKPQYKYPGAVAFWPKWLIVLVVSAALGAVAGYCVAEQWGSQWFSQVAVGLSAGAFVVSAGTSNLFKPNSPQVKPFTATTQRIGVMAVGPFAAAFGAVVAW